MGNNMEVHLKKHLVSYLGQEKRKQKIQNNIENGHT